MEDKYIEKIEQKSKELKFDLSTTTIFKNFVEDFIASCGDLMDTDIVIDRIFLAVKNGIEFVDEFKDKNTQGIYWSKESKIQIKNMSDKEGEREVAFHEFIHAIVYDPTEKICGIRSKVNRQGKQVVVGSALDEGIVTLLEERYYLYRKGMNLNRPVINRDFVENKSINGYSLNVIYAKQLQNIFGEKFLKTYLNNPRDVIELINKAIYKANTGMDELPEEGDARLQVFRSMRHMAIKRTIAWIDIVSKSKDDETNRSIEDEMIHMKLVELDENISRMSTYDILEDISQFKTLLVESQDIPRLDKYVQKAVENECAKTGKTVEEILVRLEQENKREEALDSEVSNYYEMVDKEKRNLIEKLRKQLDIDDVIKMKDINQIIKTIRNQNDFWKKYSDSQLLEIAESAIGSMGLNFDDVRFLRALCASNIEQFDLSQISMKRFELSTRNSTKLKKKLGERSLFSFLDFYDDAEDIFAIYVGDKLEDVVYVYDMQDIEQCLEATRIGKIFHEDEDDERFDFDFDIDIDGNEVKVSKIDIFSGEKTEITPTTYKLNEYGYWIDDQYDLDGTLEELIEVNKEVDKLLQEKTQLGNEQTENSEPDTK